VDKVHVDLVVSASGISFISALDQPLTESIVVRGVGATGVRSITWPAPGEAPLSTEAFSARGGGAVKITTGEPKGSEGVLSLSGITLSAGANTTLATSSDALHLGFQGELSPIGLSVTGDASIVWTSAPLQRIHASSPKLVTITPVDGPTAVSIEPEPGVEIVPSRRLLVSDLSFRVVEELEAQDSTIVRGLSTITSGTLYLPELSDTAHPLRTGVGLRFDVVEGRLDALTLSTDGISLRFSGIVRGLRIGDGTAGRDLMPSLLDWLTAQHALSLFWGTSLYLIGLLLGLLRWLKL
jgi:hypothetical protein